MNTFFVQYISWHYHRAYKESYNIWSTFLWFILKTFAISFHLQNLFSKFSRLGETYKGGGLGDRLGAFIVNFLMRLVGVFLRIFVILLGLVLWLFVLVGGLAFFVAWTLYPLIVVAFLLFAFVGIFFSYI